MSNSTNPFAAIMAAVIADALMKKVGASGKLPEELRQTLPPEVVRKLETGNCGDPTCEGCNPKTGTEACAEAQEAASEPSADAPTEMGIAQAMVIPPEVAELVGLRPDEPADSLETRARATAAALIINLRELGAQPVDDIKKAITRKSGLKFAEDSILAAIHTFNSLAAQ